MNANASQLSLRKIPGVKQILLVASGKGGVGKSTLAVNIATALSGKGLSVGLVDADVYGPSIPTMLGIEPGSRPGSIPGHGNQKPLLIPFERYGIKMMSMGFLVDPEQPMVWRGPMIASAAMQLFNDVKWGELDILVVDLPPGTGDIHLSIGQQVHVDGAVIVTTPQEVALADVRRAKSMFDKVNTPILGLIENMSYFVCDSCEKKHEIFRSGGGARGAQEMGIEAIGEIPLEPAVNVLADQGIPAVVGAAESQSAKAIDALADNILAKLNTLSQEPTFVAPSINISGKPPSKTSKKSSLNIVSQ